MAEKKTTAKKKTAAKKKTKAKKPLIKIPKIDMGEVRSFAESAVRGLVREQIPGPDKHEAAVKQVAEFIDAKLEFGDGVIGSIAESLDGPAAKLLVGFIVKEAYEELSKPPAHDFSKIFSRV